MRRLPIHALFVIAAAALGADAAQAQERGPLTTAQPYHQTIGLNPLLMPIGIFSADYERALTPWLTVGVGGTYGDPPGDDPAGWVDLKARYYPGEQALKGFSVGLTAGWAAAHAHVIGPELFDVTYYERSDDGPTLGVMLGYNWLLGKRHRFLVGLGVGAKRVMKHVDDESALEQVMPNGRFVMGLAF